MTNIYTTELPCRIIRISFDQEIFFGIKSLKTKFYYCNNEKLKSLFKNCTWLLNKGLFKKYICSKIIIFTPPPPCTLSYTLEVPPSPKLTYLFNSCPHHLSFLIYRNICWFYFEKTLNNRCLKNKLSAFQLICYSRIKNEDFIELRKNTLQF